MRTAYSGRAAAYEKKGDLDKALPDHNMVVLLCAVETEILTNLEAPDRGEFFVEAAQAYRARAKCLEALGRRETAQADRQRADGLEADARKVVSKSQKVKNGNAASVQLINGWTEPVTVMAAGVSYRLEVGEQVTIPASGNSVAYELRAGSFQTTGTLTAGKSYTIRVTVP